MALLVRLHLSRWVHLQMDAWFIHVLAQRFVKPVHLLVYHSIVSFLVFMRDNRDLWINQSVIHNPRTKSIHRHANTSRTERWCWTCCLNVSKQPKSSMQHEQS